MRLIPRTDLGGFASALPAVVAQAEVPIERPFVLLCGPNGSGKTGLISMIRAATGLSGSEQGRIVDEQFDRAPSVADCAGDLGMLAAFQGGFGEKARAPRKGFAGVLDVEALGWTGQRTWILDTRADTNLASASSFMEPDLTRQIGLIFGAKESSHGQLLQHGLVKALRWALGIETPEDPYDFPESLPESRRALWDAVTGGKPRPEERWLFLDEPETALDAESLFVGLSVLLQEAAPGKLRVFCASHSPLFAAGMATQPTVQVIDLGGRRPWFEMQRNTLKAAADPGKVSSAADVVIGRMRLAEEARKAEERVKMAAKLDDLLSGLPAKALEIMVEAGRNGGRADRPDAPKTSLRDWKRALASRGLAKRGFMPDTHVDLTQLGMETAAEMARRPAKAKRSRKTKPEAE